MNALDEKIIEIIKYPERYPKKHGNFGETMTKTFPYLIVYEYIAVSTIPISAIYDAKRNPKRKNRRLK
jgi:hypothetical protein